jgi:hypothetical protein
VGRITRFTLGTELNIREPLRLRSFANAQVLVSTIHRDDSAYEMGQGAVLDGELHQDEKIGPLEVIGVSGKSPGEVAFLWPERKVCSCPSVNANWILRADENVNWWDVLIVSPKVLPEDLALREIACPGGSRGIRQG